MKRAFTLVELMIAMLVSSIIILGICSFYKQAMRYVRISSRNTAVSHELTEISDLFRNELTACYAFKTENTDDEDDNKSFKLIREGKGFELIFHTRNSCWYRNQKDSYQARVSYTFTRGERGGLLERSEKRTSGSKVISVKKTSKISDKVVSMSAMVLAKGKWVKELTTDELPEAIRIQFSLVGLETEMIIPLPGKDSVKS